MKLIQVLLQGIRADQPDPNDVADGSLYFVTDEGLIEQSVSGSWTAYSGAGGGGGGGLTLLDTQIASASATLDFESVIDSTYDEYLIEIVGIKPATDGAELWMRVSTDNGATYEITNYAWIKVLNSTTAAIGTFGSASDTRIQISVDIDSAAAQSYNGSLRLFNPLSASLEKAVFGQATMFQNSSGVRVSNVISGWWTGTTAINAIRFLMDSGNIASGVIRLYGVEK